METEASRLSDHLQHDHPLIPLRSGAVRKVDAHVFERERHEHYIEMRWNDRVLFDAEPFEGFIHDPCCGWGRIPEAARAVGHIGVTGSDIVNRGFDGCGIEDFLKTKTRRQNIVMNPPFKLVRQFIEHSCAVTEYKVASIMLARSLAAAHWLRELPFVQVWYLTPRPSMPTGQFAEDLMISQGKDPSGGTQEFVWVIFDMKAVAGRRTEFGWLHRDRGAI